MNKLFKRTTAFVLMVCLLCALAVPAVYAAPAEASDDGSYVYDFLAVADTDTYWWMNGTTKMAFGGGRSFPCSNSTEASTFEKYYEDGKLNWCNPAIPGTKTSLSAIANTASGAASQLATDCLLFKASTNENIAWFMLKIKAPEVGTYDLSITHKTENNSGARHIKVQIVPAWALPAYEDFDAAAHNAQVDAIVAAGDNMLPGVMDCDQDKSAAGVVTDMGKITLSDVNAEDYYVIFSMDLSKSDTASSPTNNGVRMRLQSLTLTPCQETAAEANAASYNLGLGEKAMTVEEGALEEVATRYEAGTRDTMIAGIADTFSMDKCKVEKGSVYFGYSISPASNRAAKWIAIKFRAPGNGDYNMSIATKAATTEKSGSDFNVYLLDAAGVTDYAAAMTDANKICTSELSVSNLTVDLGKQTFVEGKEYLVIVQGASYNAATQADNFYLTSLNFTEILSAAAKIGDAEYLTVAEAVAAAKAGDVVVLGKDYVGALDLPAGVSIDLNGCTWTVSSVVATNAAEAIIDSKGTGKLVTKSVELFGNNSNALPLKTADNTYALAAYELSVTPNDYEAVGSKTRFWFNLELDDAYLDMIAAGNTGMTIGVELTWGEQSLAVTLGQNGDAAAFAAAWAAAKKGNDNIWLYVDITGVAALESDLIVKPVLTVGDTTLNNGTITYTVG